MSGAVHPHPHLFSSCGLHGISGRTVIPSSNGNSTSFQSPFFLRTKLPFTFGSTKPISFACSASSDNERRNPDFSGNQHRGPSAGKFKQTQDRDFSPSDNLEDTNLILSSKNGGMLSPSAAASATAVAPKQVNNREIVELFSNYIPQMRAAEKKWTESNKTGRPQQFRQQGKEDSEAFDSLLKLLKKHGVDRKKKTSSLEFDKKSNSTNGSLYEEELNPNLSSVEGDETESENETGNESVSVSSLTRPPSNFMRKSPVPTVKFEPVVPLKEQSEKNKSKRKKKNKTESLDGESQSESESDSSFYEPVVLDGLDDRSEPEPISAIEIELEPEVLVESVAVAERLEVQTEEKGSDLGSLKVSELREIAKSRGMKGFSKMKKAELVELLSCD